MKVSEQIQADLEAVKTNLAETKDDLAEILALNAKQAATLTALEASIEDLKKQLAEQTGEITALDAIAAQVAELKATSRAIADVVPEPPAEEPAPTPVEG